MGVFDLRWADNRSYVGSKGGDGMTPIVPALLPADRLDPSAIEVRAGLDGELVQEDSASTLIFSVPQIVSDLSQLVTLEPGGVILTGTPADASTFSSGQTVEVEVTATALDGERLSTGRLASTVRVGDQTLPAYSAQPKPTPEQWADASGRPVSELQEAEAPVLDDDLRDKLSRVALATLSSALRKRGLNNASIDGLTSTQPGKRLVGTARTLRYVPNREDLFKTPGGGYNAQKRLFDIGAPTYHAGGHPAVLGRTLVPWSFDETIACGGATVQPGDIIVGDGDGVLVIPPALVRELVEEQSLAQAAGEEWIARQVDAGHPVDGLFPMNAQWRAKYEAEASVTASS